MTTTTDIRYADETDPDTRIAWKDPDGTLRDFTGWTLVAEVVAPAGTLELAKSVGVVGGDGTGTYNVNVAWTAAELAQIVGTWRLRVTATNGTERAVFGATTTGALPYLIVRNVPA